MIAKIDYLGNEFLWINESFIEKYFYNIFYIQYEHYYVRGGLCHNNSEAATSQYSGIIAMIIVRLFFGLNNAFPPHLTLNTYS